jgi:hypothetical protein
MKAFADLADLPEDERIRLAAETAARGNVVGVVTDDEPGKPERYIRKLEARGVRVLDRGPGPVKHTVLIRVGPKES